MFRVQFWTMDAMVNPKWISSDEKHSKPSKCQPVYQKSPHEPKGFLIKNKKDDPCGGPSSCTWRAHTCRKVSWLQRLTQNTCGVLSISWHMHSTWRVHVCPAAPWVPGSGGWAGAAPARGQGDERWPPRRRSQSLSSPSAQSACSPDSWRDVCPRCLNTTQTIISGPVLKAPKDCRPNKNFLERPRRDHWVENLSYLLYSR